ncbi:MAG: twin-arginine translocase TatA/TatE family subunit [Chloroflexi bacterium]|nr:twin-arginine translocase TatA/TatE family subunit [Chloroflexota bacterium]
MELFGVGVMELGLIMLITLIVVGPQRFPEVARQLAQWIRNARAFTDSVMKDVRAAVDEIEQEVTAANDGVNPIRELQDLRKELDTAAKDATSTVSDATALPPTPINDEWAAVAETTATDAVIEPAPEPAVSEVSANPVPTVEPEPPAEPVRPAEPAAPTQERRADA